MNRVRIEILAGGDKVNSDGSYGKEESKNWWGQGLESAPQWIRSSSSSLGVAGVAGATSSSSSCWWCPSIVVLVRVHVHDHVRQQVFLSMCA